MFFIARATAPMLPGCEGSTSTMRMSVEIICYDSIIGGLFGITHFGPGPRGAAFFRPLERWNVGTAAAVYGVYLSCMRFSISLSRRLAAPAKSLSGIWTASSRSPYVQRPQRLRERGRHPGGGGDHCHHPQALPESCFSCGGKRGDGDNDTVWIIDPLDGTTNFLHEFPVFAVSIACQQGRLGHA